MPIKKLSERSALVIALFLTFFIAFLSLVPLSFKGSPISLIKISNADKYGHLIAYLILSLSWFYAAKNFAKRKYKKLIIILSLISYGIVLEVLQGTLTTYRQADFYDFIANSAGVILATILFEKIK